MTGLDTNILVRYFMQDDPARVGLAEKIIAGLSPYNQGWICLPVLVELVWVLTRVYRIRKTALVYVLDTLVESPKISFEQDDSVRTSLHIFRNSNADFQDCLIARLTKAAGCGRTLTFDEIAAQDAGMELVS